jgi:hypothetical protein
MHSYLAKSCLRLMSDSLRQDICDLGSPGALTSQLSSSELEKCISAELRYACCYWVSHIQRSEAPLRDGEQTHHFLQKHLLHWLEVLSLIGKVPDSVRMVTELLFRVSCPVYCFYKNLLTKLI